jgi:FkbM family methyltransferase
MATLYCRFCTGTCNWENALRRMALYGFAPRSILDIGACRGDWTHICKSVFCAARVQMVEPLRAKRSALERIVQQYDDVSLSPALLGAAARSDVPFYEQDSLSSILPFANKGWTPSCTLDMQTLDALVADTPFAQSELIKIHVQGSELEVLKGAERTLATAEAVFVLVSLQEVYEGSPLFHDVEAFMAARNFRVYDIVHRYLRDLDAAMAQIDVVFLNNGSRLLSWRGW